MLETLAAFNSIEMLGGHAFVPPIGPVGYKRMKERRPVRTKDGWLTMLPYSGENWCAFFEAVGHPECIEEFSVRDPVLRASNIDKIYKRMGEIALTRTTAEWEELLLSIDVPHTGFAKLTEVAEQPHLKAVGLFVDLDHPTEGKIRQARPTANFRKARPEFIAWRHASASTPARSCRRPATPMETLPRSSSARQQELVELAVGCLCATVHSTAVAKPQCTIGPCSDLGRCLTCGVCHMLSDRDRDPLAFVP